MFDIKEIIDIIAERRLHLEDQPNLHIRILLGRPQTAAHSSDGDFILCPFQILGVGDEKVRCAGGVDAFQALQLAMEMIGSELYFKLNRRHGGKLRWEAGKDAELGFPVPSGLEKEI